MDKFLLLLVRYSGAIRKKESSGRENSIIFPGLERQRRQKIGLYGKESFREQKSRGGCTMIVKRIGPMSLAKITGTLYTALGLLIGGIISMVSLVGGFASSNPEAAAFGALFGAGAIVIFPIVYGGGGFVMMLLGAWLYNVVAGFVGGVEMDVQ
jgi:hypothetical protein